MLQDKIECFREHLRIKIVMVNLVVRLITDDNIAGRVAN